MRNFAVSSLGTSLAHTELPCFSIRLEINEPVRGKNLADDLEIREQSKVKAKKPVIILTNESMIEGESRKMTETGIFLACKEILPKNETYTMAIRVSQKESVIVKGELIWSNQDSLRLGSPLSDVGMCFIKILEEDRHLFSHKVIDRLKA